MTSTFRNVDIILMVFWIFRRKLMRFWWFLIPPRLSNMTRQKSLAQTKIHQESFEKPTTHVSYLPNMLIPKVHYMDIFSIYSTLHQINCKIVMIIICTQYLLVNTKVEKYWDNHKTIITQGCQICTVTEKMVNTPNT